ncbi:NUDIX hydrolase [Xanthobacter sp. DSM 24535]|uniref:NUDIX hydrolase n=1 Tax=Roseixanthobacter psychrophilus TaxID=3119917 RepID=UPI00372A3711
MDTLTVRAPARVVPVRQLDIRVEPGVWHEAEAHRPEIDAHFAARVAANPFLWNGRVLVLRRYTLEDGVLCGACIEIDYASFTWWRDRDWPDLGVWNIFALPALEGSDGVFVMGEMGAHTVNAGRVFFPGGTPDLSDITPSGAVDLYGSVLRELEEETGLSDVGARLGEGWEAVFDGAYICLMRRMVFPQSAAALAERIDAFIAGEKKPELARTILAAGPQDLGPPVASFAADYLRWRWARD